jgi:hypothetical protein
MNRDRPDVSLDTHTWLSHHTADRLRITGQTPQEQLVVRT